jgi:nucleoside phosphorylase
MKRAVILTALELEFLAVRRHLDAVEETIHRGSVYEIGRFRNSGQEWSVLVAQVGKGNVSAGIQANRALDYFEPTVALFVGVAGGVKDVQIGDVVAATKIYDVHAGKAGASFQPRPELYQSSHSLVQRAQAVSRSSLWQKRIVPREWVGETPNSFVGPISGGAQVVSSRTSATYKLIRRTYSDSIAVEMEGHGFLDAIHANESVSGLVVRGISDLVEGKSAADQMGMQVVAAQNAAAFAFEVLATFADPGRIKSSPVIRVSDSGEDGFSPEESSRNEGSSEFPSLAGNWPVGGLNSGSQPAALLPTHPDHRQDYLIGADPPHPVGRSDHSRGMNGISSNIVPEFGHYQDISSDLELLTRHALSSGSSDLVRIRSEIEGRLAKFHSDTGQKSSDERRVDEAICHLILGLSFEESAPSPDSEAFLYLQEASDLAREVGNPNVDALSRWGLGHFWRKRSDVTKNPRDIRRARRLLSNLVDDGEATATTRSLALVELTKIPGTSDNQRDELLAQALAEQYAIGELASATVDQEWPHFLVGFQQAVLREARLRFLASNPNGIDEVRRVIGEHVPRSDDTLPIIDHVTFPYTLAQSILRSNDASDAQRGYAVDSLLAALQFSKSAGYKRQLWSGRQIINNPVAPIEFPIAYAGFCPACFNETIWTYEKDFKEYQCDKCGARRHLH